MIVNYKLSFKFSLNKNKNYKNNKYQDIQEYNL